MIIQGQQAPQRQLPQAPPGGWIYNQGQQTQQPQGQMQPQGQQMQMPPVAPPRLMGSPQATPGQMAGTPPTPPAPTPPAPTFNHPLSRFIPDYNQNHPINQYLVPEVGPGSGPPTAPPAPQAPPTGAGQGVPNMPSVPPGWLPQQQPQGIPPGWDIQGDILRRPGGNPPTRQPFDRGGIPADGGQGSMNRSPIDAIMDPSPYNNAVDRGGRMINSIGSNANSLTNSSPAFGNLSSNLLSSLGGQWNARGNDMQNQAGLEFSRMAGTRVPQEQLSQMLGLRGLENDWLGLDNDRYRNDVLRSTGSMDSIMQLLGALGGFF